MNRARSVADRLVAISRLRKEDHHLVLVRYGGERLLERISRHPILCRFVLKGATLFLAWEEIGFRATRDIDLLGFGSSELEPMRILFGEVCREDASERDGPRFDEESVEASRIKEDQFHEGIRVRLVAFLERTRISLQVDIGFGDADEGLPRLDRPGAKPLLGPRYMRVGTFEDLRSEEAGHPTKNAGRPHGGVRSRALARQVVAILPGSDHLGESNGESRRGRQRTGRICRPDPGSTSEGALNHLA